MLPADDASYGFDNIAGVQRMSPTLMERYLAAAQKISRVAVGASDARGDDRHVSRPARASAGRSPGRPAVRHARRHRARYTFPRDGEYGIRVQLTRRPAPARRVPAFDQPQTLELSIDGSPVTSSSCLPAAADGARIRPGTRTGGSWTRIGRSASRRRPAPGRGAHLSQQDARAAREPARAVPEAGSGRPNGYYTTQKGAYLRSVEISGPFDATRAGRYAEPAPDFCVPPGEASATKRAARGRFSRRWPAARSGGRSPMRTCSRCSRSIKRAARKGIRARDRARARGSARQPGVPVPRRARTGEQAAAEPDLSHQRSRAGVAPLVLPVEQHPGRRAAATSASAGELRESGGARAAGRRMLADPRADALVSNFVGQWLFLRNLPSRRCPIRRRIPDFDEDLRQGFRRETELFSGSILREDRSVLDLLTANYTFVNERLARHYGIPNVHGAHFRRVDADRRQPPRPARSGQHSVRHLVSEPHVAGRARQVDPGEPARHAAAAAAAGRAAAGGEAERGGRRAVDARADRAASRQSGVRQLPRDDGSARPCARELRLRRTVADRR